jgi:hypothetical protein
MDRPGIEPGPPNNRLSHGTALQFIVTISPLSFLLLLLLLLLLFDERICPLIRLTKFV